MLRVLGGGATNRNYPDFPVSSLGSGTRPNGSRNLPPDGGDGWGDGDGGGDADEATDAKNDVLRKLFFDKKTTKTTTLKCPYFP